jgi:hypothetical protein
MYGEKWKREKIRGGKNVRMRRREREMRGEKLEIRRKCD